MPEETTPKAKPAKPRGRPKGAKTAARPTIEASPSRCQAEGCGSTEREPYSQTREQPYAGIHDGQPYTHIVRRWTVCSTCGQARVDKTYENRPKTKN